MNRRRVAALLRELADERRRLPVYGETPVDVARKVICAHDPAFGAWLVHFRDEQRSNVRECPRDYRDETERSTPLDDLVDAYDEFGEVIDEADLAVDIFGCTPSEVAFALADVERPDLLGQLSWGIELYASAKYAIALGEHRCANTPDARPCREAAAPEVAAVYFVQQGDAGPIKIGKADNVQKRLRGLQTSNPFPLRLLAWLPLAGLREEGELHERFASFRLRGEWFKPAPELLAYIEAVETHRP